MPNQGYNMNPRNEANKVQDREIAHIHKEI